MSAKTVVLWRHGETAWNSEGRFQGQGDVPLNERGFAQARAAAPALASFRPARIVSSDLARARATAQTLGDLTGLPVELDRRLREVHVGEWEGLYEADIHRLDPTFYPDVRAGRDHRRSPTGETALEAGQRCAMGLLDIAETTPDDELVVVAGHGLAFRVALALLMGLGLGESMLVGSMANCAWNIMRPLGDHWRLQAFNVTAEPRSAL
ncbi:MAG: histidine phosphatase family protein [Propionibacteriaceae bacterium]|nr:histidine phosphatase family protein [Micropruina sp.]